MTLPTLFNLDFFKINMINLILDQGLPVILLVLDPNPFSFF